LSNQDLVQLGAWKKSRQRRSPIVEFWLWNPLETVSSTPAPGQSVNRDSLARTRFYQSLLDAGVVRNRAALARYVGTSRANMIQALRRLKHSTAVTTQRGATDAPA
jgi:hypothetical protein